MLKIYLGDLVYDTVKTNYVVPLGSGYLAAMLNKRFPGKTDITIIKYPKNLEKALNASPPDVLALSNYSWNTNLNKIFLKMAKKLNPNIITVMGGPNIRIDSVSIEKYLRSNADLDFYVLFEGEEPFADLIGAVLEGHKRPVPPSGCATILDDRFIYQPVEFNKKSKYIDSPSPYLTGLLDEFLANKNMIPLIETNRGCPHRCVYCAWGIAALSKVRQRPLELVFQELDYVADRCGGQLFWIFCDANFGILPRDVDIARKVREIRERKGYPTKLMLGQSKNTSQRNIEIAKTLGDNEGYIAIQSTDPVVLKNCGRGNTDFTQIQNYIDYYKNNKMSVETDILIGLPGETAESHLKSLEGAFAMGFDKIHPYNIRMLPGSRYESDEFRQKYHVVTKYRPIFGCYGIYNNERVFELEESVRATKDMTESELDYFKVLHWLIYFSWDVGIFKPILYYGQRYGLNPFTILHKLYLSDNPIIKDIFLDMRKRSMSEWFANPKDMLTYYNLADNFNDMVNHFVKLNAAFVAQVYQDSQTCDLIKNEVINILTSEIKARQKYNKVSIDALVSFTDKLICKDLLQEEFHIIDTYPREIIPFYLSKNDSPGNAYLKVEIYRPKDYVKFCNYHLNPNNQKDLSIRNITRFLDTGGWDMLTNKIRVIA